MYRQIDIFSDIIALDLGIIHPTVACAWKDERPRSIDEALSTMTPEDARKCRRKFRKIARELHRCSSAKRNKHSWSPRRKRAEVMAHIRCLAWDMIGSIEGGDNDQRT